MSLMPKKELLSLLVGELSFFASLFKVIGVLFTGFADCAGLLALFFFEAFFSFCPLKGIILTGSVKAFFFPAHF
ncbi:hypothetical protein DXU93_06840 [Brumimicrobium aurantiacum]|uniref:Uncharacterized protein n=1 Tax=Brumimicrobium aurantiacum TaxID=1737063 RepID=A0A3E1EZ08_9FLAO|nr:hypothetical protein DXU93_06840 [Brumimicrobium aurantiacum]